MSDINVDIARHRRLLLLILLLHVEVMSGGDLKSDSDVSTADVVIALRIDDFSRCVF